MGAKKPTKLAGKPASSPAPASPSSGSVLRQYFGISEVAGDVRRLVGTFNPREISIRDRLLMRLDPVIAFGLAILRAPLINLRWSIESKDPIIAAFCEQALRPHYRQLATAATLAIPFGFQVIEKVWETQLVDVEVENKIEGRSTTSRFPNAWTYRKFKGINPQTLSLLVDPIEDEWAGVRQKAKRVGGTSVDVGTERVVLWSYRKEEVWGALTGFPHLDQVYEPWWWKTAMNLFANRYFERKADPIPKGRAQAQVTGSDGKPVDGFQFMADQMAALKNGGILLLPATKDKDGNYLFDVELLQDDKRGDMYQQRIDKLDTQILRGLWITDKAATAGDGTGSLAQAEQHAEVLAENLETIQNEFISDVVNPQVLDPLVVYNFGADKARTSQTKIRAGGLSSGMRDLLKEILINLLQTEQLLANGKKVKLAERLDAVAIAAELELPLVPIDELENLVDSRTEDPNGNQPPDPNLPINDQAVADSLVNSGALDSSAAGGG